MLKVSDNPPMLADGTESIADLQGDWWVAHTKARAEKALAWELLAFSIPYFLPMTEKTMIWGGRKRRVLSPMFSSYVFFNGDREDRHRVMTTNRVCQIIPVRLRSQLVQELESIRVALASNIKLDMHPFAAVGRRCRVSRGPLQGIEGIVICKDNVTRLVLQVSLISKGALLEIEPELLEAID